MLMTALDAVAFAAALPLFADLPRVIRHAERLQLHDDTFCHYTFYADD